MVDKKERDKIYRSSEKGRLENKHRMRRRRQKMSENGYRAQHRIRKKLDEIGAGFCNSCGHWRYAWLLDVDHIVPLSFGGRDEFLNIQVLCVECHKEKTKEELRRLFNGDT